MGVCASICSFVRADGVHRDEVNVLRLDGKKKDQYRTSAGVRPHFCGFSPRSRIYGLAFSCQVPPLLVTPAVRWFTYGRKALQKSVSVCKRRKMIIAWIIIGYLLVFIPVAELLAYRRYKKQIAANTFNKQVFYNSVFIELWTPVVGILILVLQGEIKLQDMRLNAIVWNPFGINSWLFVVAVIVSAIPILLILLSIYNFIGIKRSIAFREAYIAAIKKQEDDKAQESKKVLYAILPRSLHEKVQWTFLSITAGITEEILFRGFLVFYIHYAFPSIPIPLLCFLQAIPFALMHLYQGAQGVITTLLMGVILGLYVIVSGSIIPGIIVHILLDLTSNLIEHEQVQGVGTGNS